MKVQNSNAIVDNTKELKKRKNELVQCYKDKIQNDTNTYYAWKRDLDERMDQKPLLLESSLYFGFIIIINIHILLNIS